MAIREILKMGDVRLLRVAQPVTAFDSDELHLLISDMLDTMAAANGAGLAAPQIGVDLQLVIFGTDARNPRYPDAPPVPRTVLINPVITPLGDPGGALLEEEDWEGCLSVPGLRAVVPRFARIRYAGFDQYGDPIARTVEGFHARVVQHECDHLIGKLYPMRVRDFSRFGFTEVLFPQLAAVALPTEDAGQILRVTVSDITERKQVSQELIDAIHAREDAKTANYDKTQFLANISHEFRTPMNGVMGMAQLLQLPGLTEAERIDYAGVVLSSGQALMNLLNDVLDITRMEAGKLELESVRLVPAQIVGAVEAVFSQSARGKGLALESAWIGPELSYRGDPLRLTQMLSNLVNNAIKFTAQGSVRIEAREVARTAQTATLEFAVSDTGIGIDPQQQALLFQSFFQVDSSNTRSYDGAGLGLSMVRKLAELMGGEVGVQSQLGQGSRFWFRIQVQGLGPTD